MNEAQKMVLEQEMSRWIERVKTAQSVYEREIALKVLKDKQLEYEVKGFGTAIGKELTKELDVVPEEVKPVVQTKTVNLNDPSRKVAFEAMKRRYKEKSIWNRIQRKLEGSSPDWDRMENNATLDASYFNSQYKSTGKSR